MSQRDVASGVVIRTLAYRRVSAWMLVYHFPAEKSRHDTDLAAAIETITTEASEVQPAVCLLFFCTHLQLW